MTCYGVTKPVARFTPRTQLIIAHAFALRAHAAGPRKMNSTRFRLDPSVLIRRVAFEKSSPESAGTGICAPSDEWSSRHPGLE
jgi:hypothetical protein